MPISHNDLHADSRQLRKQAMALLAEADELDRQNENTIKNVTISIERDLCDIIDRAARRQGLTRDCFLRRCVKPCK